MLYLISDQYAKDIALNAPSSYMVNKAASAYSKKDIEAFKAINDENNALQQADQAAFYLYKP